MTPGRRQAPQPPLTLALTACLAAIIGNHATAATSSRIIFPDEDLTAAAVGGSIKHTRRPDGFNFAPIETTTPSILESGGTTAPLSQANDTALIKRPEASSPAVDEPDGESGGVDTPPSVGRGAENDASSAELTTATLQRSAPVPGPSPPTTIASEHDSHTSTERSADVVYTVENDDQPVRTETVTVVPIRVERPHAVIFPATPKVSTFSEGGAETGHSVDSELSVAKTELEIGEPSAEPEPEPEPEPTEREFHASPRPRGGPANFYWPGEPVPTTRPPRRAPGGHILFPTRRTTALPTRKFPPAHWPTLPVNGAPVPSVSVTSAVTPAPGLSPPRRQPSSKLQPPRVHVPIIPAQLIPPHPEPESEPEPTGHGVPVWANPDELEPFAEPAPEWDRARAVWGPAWPLHNYSGGGLFAALAFLALISLLRVGSFKHLLSRPYFMTLTALVLLLTALRAVYLLLDPYNAEGTLALPVNYLLFNIPVPCITSAFSIIFLSLLNATQVQLLRPRIQSSGCLIGVVAFHFIFSIGTDLIVGFQFEGQFLLALCQMMFICWGLTLSVGYWYIFGTLYRAALRRQADAMRDTITKLQIEGGVLPRRLPRPTLGVAVRLTVIISVLGLLLAALQAYGMVWVYDAFGVFGGSQLNRPRPWSWWCYQTLARGVELIMAALLLYVGSQPLRHHEPRQRPACAVFSLCGSWPGGARLRPKPSDHLMTAELDYYPAVCNRNQVVQSASQDGRLAFTDRLALGAGHALPVSLSQRRTMRRSTSSDRATTPGSSRPPSLLQNVPAPTPPARPPDAAPVETTYQPVLAARTAFSTVRSSGTQTSEEYTDVCQPYVVGSHPAATHSRASRSLDTDDPTSSAQPTPSRGGRCRQASTCSSESAAHSFTVRLYHTADGCGAALPARLRQRPLDGAAGNTCPWPARHRLSCPLPADHPVRCAAAAEDDGIGSSSSEGATNFLTDASTSGSLSQPNLTDSRGGLSDSRADLTASLSRGGSTPTLDSPRHGAGFSLPLRRPVAGVTDATSDDITPDSAVVVDYDGECLHRETSCDVTDAPSVHSAGTRGSTQDTAVTKRPGRSRFFPVASAASLTDVVRQCRSRSGSRNLLDKLRGSTFSLQIHKKGYSPLGSTGSVRKPSESESTPGLVDCCTQTDFPSCATSRSDVTSDIGDAVSECDVTDDAVTSGLSRHRLQQHITGLCRPQAGLELTSFVAPDEETGV